MRLIDIDSHSGIFFSISIQHSPGQNNLAFKAIIVLAETTLSIRVTVYVIAVDNNRVMKNVLYWFIIRSTQIHVKFQITHDCPDLCLVINYVNTICVTQSQLSTT